MPTPSEQTRNAEYGVRNDAPHRSVFGNYKLAKTEGPGSENAVFPLSPTAIELSELRQDRSADFSPLPAVLAGPERGGLKSALLNSMAVGPG